MIGTAARAMAPGQPNLSGSVFPRESQPPDVDLTQAHGWGADVPVLVGYESDGGLYTVWIGARTGGEHVDIGTVSSVPMGGSTSMGGSGAPTALLSFLGLWVASLALVAVVSAIVCWVLRQEERLRYLAVFVPLAAGATVIIATLFILVSLKSWLLDAR